MQRRIGTQSLRLIAKACARRTQTPMPEVAKRLGVDLALLRDPEASVEQVQMGGIWQRALAWLEDPGFGLSLAEELRPGMLGAVDYLFRNSEQLGAGYEELIRFQNLLQQGSSVWSLQRDSSGIRVQYQLLPPEATVARHIVEYAFASFVKVGRQASGVQWQPLELSFRHARAFELERYEAALGCTPRFSAEHNEITLSAETCALSLESADTHLAEIVRRYADEKQRAMGSSSVADTVRNALRSILARGDLSLTAVAKELGCGERTLRRRLANEDVCYQSLLDELRYELARSQLDRGQMSSTEIALLLGFSDVSAFYRAFRRWSGKSLSAYRSAQAAAHGG